MKDTKNINKGCIEIREKE